MILRLIRGRARPDQLESLRAALGETVGAGIAAPALPARFQLGTRPSGDHVEVVLVAFWTSTEALALADEQGASPLRVAEQIDLRFLEAAHFEVDETILRHSDQLPVVIRVATGRFSKQGADIQMQDLLRERAPQLGGGMIEAYVGRRLIGRAVEVTFVTTWLQAPTGQPLEEPFWPDIALRYDHFDVEVYAAVAI